MISLTDGITAVELHPDLLWSDEFNWSPVQQTVTPTITGAMVVQVGTRTAGRPITLEPEDDDSAWMTRAVVEQLRNWAAAPGKELTLTLREQVLNVMFRLQDGGVEAAPVIHYSDIGAEDYYRCTLRLMEI